MMNYRIIAFTLVAALLVSCSPKKTGYWPNGNLKMEIELKGNLYHGVAKYWYEDGTLETSCTYSDNLLNGLHQSFFPSGRLKLEQHFKAGKLDGTVKTWAENGKLLAESNYSNGLPHGHYVEYYPDQSIKIEGRYVMGDHDGMWLYYDPSGSIVGEGNFTRGTGVQKSYYNNGVTKQMTHYIKDLKDGEEVFYKSDGSIEVINIFDHGKLLRKILK